MKALRATLTEYPPQTRLDKGNEPWAAYAKSARSLTAAMKHMKFKPGP